MVGFGAQTYMESFSVRDLHWIADQTFQQANTAISDTDQASQTSQPLKVHVRIRHTGTLIPATFNPQTLQVTLDEPTQGIAEGQSAVFYQQQGAEKICIAGAMIAS